MSNREYEARGDLLELHSYVDAGMRPADIARAMDKDPAWISRGIKKLRDDPTLTFRKPHEGEAITKMLSRLEFLYQQAIRASIKNRGRVQLTAIRTAASILQRLADYQIRVGLVEPRKRCNPFSTDAGPEAAIELYEKLLGQREEFREGFDV